MTSPPDPSTHSGFDALADGTLTAGRHTYGQQLMTLRHWGEGARVRVGSFCSFASPCTVFLGGEHRTDWVTTYPFTAIPGWQEHVDAPGHPATKGDVVIGNDVWVGADVTIMSGVTIGDGAVLGARCVVASDVAPYAIVAGNPARRVSDRFPPDQVAALLELRWWDWPDERIREHLHLLCSPDVAGLLGAARDTPAS